MSQTHRLRRVGADVVGVHDNWPVVSFRGLITIRPMVIVLDTGIVAGSATVVMSRR